MESLYPRTKQEVAAKAVRDMIVESDLQVENCDYKERNVSSFCIVIVIASKI